MDASFRVEKMDGRFALFFASRGGSIGTPNARNSQYHIGLTLLLRRLKHLDAEILEIVLDSVAAQKLPFEARRLPLPTQWPLPIRLAWVDDVGALRLAISEAQRNVLVAPGRNAKHGNRVRSIRIFFRLPGIRMTASLLDVVQALAGDEDQAATIDPQVLERRARRLKLRGTMKRPDGNLAPPRVSFGSTERHMRLPSVVAYVLHRGAGRCELCGCAPFITDVGEAYLEVHHVVRLADGGADTPWNAVALCPNCHREMHFGINRAVRVETLYSCVPELRRPVDQASDAIDCATVTV